MNTHGIFEFKVRGYECGPDGRATFASLCNYMQEAAGLQANAARMAKQDFDEEGLDVSWILTRMRVKIDRYPKWWDTVKVMTFPRGGRKVVIYRDYQLSVGDEVIGRATSEWMLLDLKTRKLAPIPQRVYDVANDELAPVLGDGALSKLRWDKSLGLQQPSALASSRFAARRGDIDVNGHVNNVKYIEWTLEALPPMIGPVADFEIVFKSETMAGDEIVTESVPLAPNVYLVHAADQNGKDHVVAKIAVAT